jgi:hypothetical protein
MESGKPGLLMERLFAMLDATGVRLWAEIDESVLDDADVSTTHEHDAGSRDG